MPIARTLFVESKKLRIFDFDDTLVKTNSFIYVTHRNGMKTKLSPGQYAKYDTRDGITIETFGIGASTKSNDGRIAFGGPKGAALFNPLNLPKEKYVGFPHEHRDRRLGRSNR